MGNVGWLGMAGSGDDVRPVSRALVKKGRERGEECIMVEQTLGPVVLGF